jgi:hypothetical protein
MSTRSAIIIENKDGTAEGIYCHSDGYPEHQAPILLKHYNTEERVRQLIALGDLSVLRENIGEKHDFDKDSEKAYKNKWCTAYTRDRGEDTPPTSGKNWQEVASQIDHNHEVYIYRVGLKWHYQGYSTDGELTPLKNVKLIF